MAKTTSAGNKMVSFAFYYDDKLVFFDVAAYRVRAKHTIPMNKPTKVCSCVQHRVQGNCYHKTLASPVSRWVVGKDSVIDGDPIDWQSAGPMQALAYVEVDKTHEMAGIVDPTIGNFSAFGLLQYLTDDAPSDPPTGFLNPNRILMELETAFTSRANLVDEAVKRAGLAVKALTEMPKVNSGTAPDPATATPTVLPDWAKINKPDPRQFYVSDEVWQASIFTILNGENLLLTGPSGCGKSELCQHLAKAVDYNFAAFNMGAMSEPRTSLIGTYKLTNGQTTFDESRFVRAIRDEGNEGAVVLLDELSRAVPGAYNILLPLMDGQRYLAIDEGEGSPVVKRGDKVAIIATANIGAIYTGTEAMDAAMEERFSVTIDVTWPPEAQEITVLRSRCAGLSMQDAKKLVSFANTQRERAKEGDYEKEVSTRQLIAAGIRVGSGMGLALALEFCVLTKFRDEGGSESDRAKLRQIMQHAKII